MNKKSLNRIFILSAAGILILIAVIAALRPEEPPAETGPVIIEEAEPAIVDFGLTQITPAPTPEPVAPAFAVTLLVGRRPVLTLASEPEAQRLLWEYLTDGAVAPEGERFVSARFAEEIIIADADVHAKVTEFDDAAQMLRDTPALVPLLVVTQRIERTTGEIAVTNEEEPALARGTRFVQQIGAGARTQSTVTVEYVGGEEAQKSEPDTVTLSEARSTILRAGSYQKRDASGEPGKNEGERGKDAGGLELQYPMRGSVVSRFGLREGKMHSGLDIENNVSTKIVAPGEGVVVFCAERGAYGFTVDIDHGNGFVSRLTHLSEVEVELNQRVFMGDTIGRLSAPEEGKGKPHLHYELLIDSIPYNPEFYVS